MHTDTMFAALVGVFHWRYPNKVCMIFLIIPKTENDVGDVADKNKYVVIFTPTPAKPLHMTRNQNIGGACRVNNNARSIAPPFIDEKKKNGIEKTLL